MTIEEIKELLKIFNESGVGELELQRGKDMLRIRRAAEPAPVHAAPASPPPGPPPGPPPSPPTITAAPVPPPVRIPEPETNQVLVKSPIVGTFYEARSPGAAPFVKVGDSVEPGEILCIIESMKLMNEIEAEVGGVIAAKLVESGRPVEYGEALFAIVPR
jgi:acetyl-CoA carboxylase biotin carboxyl carrier protein